MSKINHRDNYQAGFGVIEVIIIVVMVVILGALGFVAYRTVVSNKHSATQANADKSTSAQSAQTTKPSSETCSDASIVQSNTSPDGYTRYADPYSGITYNASDAWGAASSEKGVAGTGTYADGEKPPMMVSSVTYADFQLSIYNTSDYFYYGRYDGLAYYIDACSHAWKSRHLLNNDNVNDVDRLPDITTIGGFSVAKFEAGDDGYASETLVTPVRGGHVLAFFAGGDTDDTGTINAISTRLLQEVTDFLNNNQQLLP